MASATVTGDRPAVVPIAAVVAGFLLGFLDFVWIKFVPSPFAGLGNSSAVWAVAAFVFGHLVRAGWWRAALGAAAMLVVAVPSYNLAATLIQGDDVTVMWSPVSLMWMLFGVLAGVVFGTAGGWARRTDGQGIDWRRIVGVAMPAAVLFAEAAVWARRVGDPRYGTDELWAVAIDVALGVLVVVVVARGVTERAVAVAAAVPLALIGFVGFTLAGFA